MLTCWLRIHNAIGGKVAFPNMLAKYPDVSSLYKALENRAEEQRIMRLNSPERFFAYDEAQARATERLCRENGWRIVPFDSEYYPALLRKIKDPPAVLFACGDLDILKKPRMAAVVGTRTAARKPADAAVLLGEALSLAGVTVVSGGANGIDSAAAYGATLAENAGSVTVLGRGFDPAQDAEPPAPNAVYVTELLPGLTGRAFNFPNRNRLISGMSAGTTVVEAGGKSGSLITAQDAMKQGRPVFVPASDALQSPGCTRLAEQGARRIVCPQDCIGALFPELPASAASLTPLDEAPVGRYEQSFYGIPVRTADRPAAEKLAEKEPAEISPEEIPQPPVATESPAQTEPSALPEDLSRDARTVAEAVRKGPLYVDQIIETLGLTAAEVQIAVTELELEGLIAVAPGGKIVWNKLF